MTHVKKIGEPENRRTEERLRRRRPVQKSRIIHSVEALVLKKGVRVDNIEMRFELTEEMLREFLWQMLDPNSLVIQQTLNNALAQQQEQLGIQIDDYRLTGVSVTNERGTMHAELTYTPRK